MAFADTDHEARIGKGGAVTSLNEVLGLTPAFV
jgi:hypothetical protein